MDYKKIRDTRLKSPEYNELYEILTQLEEPISAKELIERYGFNKRVHSRLNKFIELGLIEKLVEDKAPKYKISSNVKMKINHIEFFNLIQEAENGLMFGDCGEISHKNIFTRRYYNNISLFGFPRIGDSVEEMNYTDFEYQMLDALIEQYDSAFENLKLFKEILETRKKNSKENNLFDKNFEYGLISETLLIKTLLMYYNKALFELIEQDLGHKKSHDFIFDLWQETMNLAKKHKLKLSNREYPLKTFTQNHPFLFFFIFSTDIEIGMKIINEVGHKNLALTEEYLEILKNNGWFFSEKYPSIERIEEYENQRSIFEWINADNFKNFTDLGAFKFADDGTPLLFHKKKYEKIDVDKSNLAVLITGSIIESQMHKNIGVALDYYFKNIFSKSNHDDLNERHNHIISLFIMVLKNFRGSDLKIFKNDVRIGRHYTKEEINLIVKVHLRKGIDWNTHQELGDLLLIKLFENDGPWYNAHFYKFAEEIIQKEYNDAEEFEKEINKYLKKTPIKEKKEIFRCYVRARFFSNVVE